MIKIKMLLPPSAAFTQRGFLIVWWVVGVKEVALLTVRKAVDELGETL